MNKTVNILIALSMAASLGLTACKKEKNSVIPDATTTGTVVTTATDFEKQSLVFSREEEKMARDVYTALVAKWSNLSFLTNIIGSEQKHMDKIKVLLDKYGIADPVGNNAAGVFTSADIQKLYDDLTAKGLVSENEALLVGMTIEDVDIYDLQQAIAQATNDDIKQTYSSLMNASKNHMREFYAQLNSRGISYTPQYISTAEYNEIISTPKEHGGGGNGNGGNGHGK